MHLNDHLFRKVLFIGFIMCVCRESVSVCVCFKAGVWGLIVKAPDYCLTCYFLGSIAVHGPSLPPKSIKEKWPAYQNKKFKILESAVTTI